MGLGFCPVLPLGSGVRQADSQTLCLPRRQSDGNLSPPLLKPSAIDNHRTVALLTIMGTFQTQLVISQPAFACQKKVSSFFLRLAILGIFHLLLLWDVLRGGFGGFLRPNAVEFLGMVSQPYPYYESPANR